MPLVFDVWRWKKGKSFRFTTVLILVVESSCVMCVVGNAWLYFAKFKLAYFFLFDNFETYTMKNRLCFKTKGTMGFLYEYLYLFMK